MHDSALAVEKVETAQEGLRILRLTGPLTLQTMFTLQTAVREGECAAMILDVTGVPYVDSAGLGTLVGAMLTAQRAHRKMALVGANERIRALMDMSHVSQFFPNYPSLEDAEASLR